MKQLKQISYTAAAILFVAAMFTTSCKKQDVTPTNDPSFISGGGMAAHKSSTPEVFPPDAKVHGKSLADWGEELFEWTFKFDTLHSPYLDATGDLQDQHQKDGVFMLGGAPWGTTNRSVTIPHDKSLLVPLVYYFANTGCGETHDQIMPDVTGTVPYISQLVLTIDGIPVTNIDDYLSISKIFKYKGDSEWNSRFCIDGTPQEAVMGGYWVMLKPLSKGTHVIHTEGGVPVASLFKQVTWTITQK